MKRRYERPSAYIEEFTPNEYVAACGDSGTIYKFKCTAGGGERGGVYKETNGQAGLQIGRDGDSRISNGETSYLHVEKRMKQVSQMILFRIAIIFLNQQESNICGVQHGIHQRQ